MHSSALNRTVSLASSSFLKNGNILNLSTNHYRRLSRTNPFFTQAPTGEDGFPPNKSIVPTYVNNRNPRNLEKLRIGEKPQGWWLEKPGRSFWNKVTLEITARHVIGKVEHFEGQIPVIASTKEWSIRKFLYSTRDASAAKAVGEVLARRCLEAGLTELYSVYTPEDREKEKMNLFLTALENAGISLVEPDQLHMPHVLNFPVEPEKAWEVFEEMDFEEEEVDRK